MKLYSDKRFKQEWLWALLILSLILGFTYRKIIEHPNQFLVTGGDGMKNYYTFMYHVKYDTSYMSFEGMNYPFGENIIFTDNQPLLSNITKVASQIFPVIICYLPSVHNLMLLIGLILGALGLFLCFRQLKIDFFFAVLCTAGLMLLHPQSDRIHGHFGMFYPILPWIFYFWLKLWDGKNLLRYSLATGIIISLSGMLHMYYFITGAIMVSLSVFVWSVSSLQKPSVKNMSLIFLIQVVIPFLILNFLASAFNHADDRPSSPWGFFSYHSYWEGLFFSYKLPLFEFINKNIITVRDFDFEGKSYIGITAVMFCIAGIFRILLNIKAIKNIFILKDTRSILMAIFILSALISFGLPFTIPGLEGLLDYTGPFKQFRSIGRVAWVSFYAINLLAIPTVYLWLKNSTHGEKRDILYFVIPSVILIEGFMYYNQKPIQQIPIEAYYCNNDYNNFPVKGADYQALLPDPFFHVGSECYSWGDQGHIVNQNFELGYNLHLPTMGANMSRTSFRQSFLLNELVCQPYKVPDIINILKKIDSRPLLIVETKNEINEHRSVLSHWTKFCPVVYETDQYRLRKMELNMFDTISMRFNDSLSVSDDLKDIKEIQLSFTKVKGSNGWGYEAYLPKDSTMNGKYVLSYWIECTDAPRVHSITEIWQFDNNDNSIDYIGEANRYNYKRYDGNKLLIEIPVQIKNEAAKLVFRISKEKQKETEELKITKSVLQ